MYHYDNTTVIYVIHTLSNSAINSSACTRHASDTSPTPPPTTTSAADPPDPPEAYAEYRSRTHFS